MYFPKLTLFLFLLVSYQSFSQTVDFGIPHGLQHQDDLSSLNELDTKTLPFFNLRQDEFEDSINDFNKIGPWRFGHSFDVDYNLINSGTWETIPGIGRIWRLKIESFDALSLNFLFTDLRIPQNGRLTIYDENFKTYFGSYTSKNNLAHKQLGTELTFSTTAIIEFFEPLSEIGQGSLSISNIVHGYRSLDLYAQNLSRALNSSGDCNYDILCPEGNGWEMQAKSVAMIVVNGNGACSGALVNNTSNDGTPYFLTANHCGNDPSSWSFRFNWDSPSPSCATTTASTNGPINMETANGGIYRANNIGSDFFLLEISNAPPANWNIYYSGWDKTDAIPDSVIGIHHPSGDVKKICKYIAQPTQALYDAGTGNFAECWVIADWTLGVTEGGSSGSPLFDENKRIIGQLFGGQAACDNTTTTTDNGQPDYYGRFGISWDGLSSTERLKDWLDPSNSNPNFIDGLDPLNISNNEDIFAVQVIDLPHSYCGTSSATPSLSIRNNGLLTLNNLNIKIDIDGVISTIPWTGNLLSGDYDTVSLGTLNFTDGNAISIKIYTDSPNGIFDLNTSNDTIQKVISVQSMGELVSFAINTDCKSSETGIFLENSLGVLVENIAPLGSLSNNFFGNTINKYVCLVEDCYELVITDSANDGWPADFLCFLTPNIQVTANSTAVVNESTFSFTNEVRYAFCLGSAFINEKIISDFNVFPNPSAGIFTIQFFEKVENENWKIEVVDLAGRIIYQVENEHQINISHLSNGSYILKLLINGYNPVTKKIIKE